MDSERPLSPKDATQKIREIARLGTVRLSNHCRREIMTQRGFSINDVLTVLETGMENMTHTFSNTSTKLLERWWMRNMP